MIANYHTHTSRCRHAEGTEEEYVQQAAAGGLQILGFADHTPYWFDSDYYSTFRMMPEELPEYVRTLMGLREKYADRLQLLIGVEAEYYPRYFGELMLRLRDAGVEYMLLGQHFPGNEIGELHGSAPNDDVLRLRKYYDQLIDAMYTGCFTYVAHPDMFRFTGSDSVYREQARRVCRAAKSCDIPLEINFLGLREGRNYPDLRFWEMAGEEGCKVIFGSDAHAPRYVCVPEVTRKALEMVERFDLQLVHTVPLRRI